MEIDAELAQRLRVAIADVQSAFDDCITASDEARARDFAARFGSGLNVPPKPWAGFDRYMDTGVSLPDCSDLAGELQRLHKELDRVLRGDPITPPAGTVPQTSPAVDNAQKKAQAASDNV